MASTLIEPKKLDRFLGKNYQTALKNLIQEVLDSTQNPDCEKFSSLSSNFHELLQSKSNPLLETIWFYSGLSFRSSSSSKHDRLSNRFASIKELFQLIVALSGSFNSWKNIVLLSPVIYELFLFMVDFKCLEMKPKKKKKLVEEVKDLIGSILGYVNVCCDGNFDDTEGLVRSVGDLVDVWIGDKGKGNGDGNAGLRDFFPLLSNRAVEKISGGELELSELAGFVIAEAFLLKLCFEFNEGGSKKELQSEMRSWIVGSITMLQNPFFHGALLMMLLEPSLPTANLLSAEDEMSLREILYDALILVDYSFLKPKQMKELPTVLVRGISVARLMVTCEAIKLYRKQGNHKKAVSYSKAFSASSLPSQVINLVKNEIGGEEGDNGEPNGSSPAALMRWILDIENCGIRIFTDNMSKNHAKLVIDDMNEDPNHPALKSSGEKADADLFYIDNKGENDSDEEANGNDDDGDAEMKESMSAAFVAAAQTMQSAEHKQKKRKGGDSERKKLKKVKFVKHNLYEDSDISGVKSAVPQKDDSKSGSEIDNPSSDED